MESASHIWAMEVNRSAMQREQVYVMRQTAALQSGVWASHTNECNEPNQIGVK